jgi:hypothetical protein
MSYLNLKSEINYLEYQLQGYRKRIQNYEESENELRNTKKALSDTKKQLTSMEKEALDEFKHTISAFESYKQLIQRANQKVFDLHNSNYNNIINRMNSDQEKIFSQMYLLENQFLNILDDVMEKIINLNLIKESDVANSKEIISREKIKQKYLEIKKLKEKVSNVFDQIQYIYNTTNAVIGQESSRLEWEINIYNLLFVEIKRISKYVPSDELVNNQLLAKLGLENIKEYQKNTTLVVLQNINIKLIHRMKELQPIIENIKKVTNEILLDRNSILNLIKNILKGFGEIINIDDINQNKEKNKSLLEEIFNEAIENNTSQCKNFSDLIKNDFENENESFKKKYEDEKEQGKNRNKIAKEEFEKRWNKTLYNSCNQILEKFKLSANEYFLNEKYKYSQDIEKIVEKFYQSSKPILNICLLGCTKTIEKSREKYSDFTKSKNMICFLKKNELTQKLLVELKYENYLNDKELDFDDIFSFRDFLTEFAKSINKSTFETLSLCIIYPLQLSEFENEKDILGKIFFYTLQLGIGFMVLFNDETNGKDYLEKRKEIIEFLKSKINDKKQQSQFSDNEDLIISDLESLKYNLSGIFNNIHLIKRESFLTVKDSEIKEEYFTAMFRVYNEKPRENENYSFLYAKDEKTTRQRLFNAIYDFSLESILIRQKLEVKLKNETSLNEFISKFITKLYTDYFKIDCEKCLDISYNKSVNVLFIEREKTRTQIDLEYDSTLSLEDEDITEIKTQILNDIKKIFSKKHLMAVEKEAGNIIWPMFFDDYCYKFHKSFEIYFEMPKDFNEFFREKEQEKQIAERNAKFLPEK